ncbi:hypothetical protein chiPu_0005191 [Chiloscyllium punctatum]|uniref:Uncharacterized protein n=1 Tax=Chiloscyllium punctatum TaxID=137246 RepID=A0A401S8Q1_CHIPU|nr:hypothetical protein [Chiloscyllium punctatum]
MECARYRLVTSRTGGCLCCPGQASYSVLKPGADQQLSQLESGLSLCVGRLQPVGQPQRQSNEEDKFNSTCLELLHVLKFIPLEQHNETETELDCSHMTGSILELAIMHSDNVSKTHTI